MARVLPKSKQFQPFQLSIDLETQNSEKTAKKFSCNLCERKYFTKTTLKRHVDINHLKKVVATCKYCHEVFYEKAKQRNHVNAVHEKKINYKCDYCDYTSFHYSNLTFHKKRHVKEESDSENCLLCPAKFETYEDHKNHLLRCHEDFFLGPRRTKSQRKIHRPLWRNF